MARGGLKSVCWLQGALSALTLLVSAPVFAQAAAAGSAPKALTVIDEDPLPSTRANGMGGALGTTADNLDAAFHNPAGIGGLGPVDRNAPLVRKLYFPEITAEANKNAEELVSTLKKDGASSNSIVGQTAIDSNADKREFARANVSTGVVLGRALIVPFSDTQIAAVPRGGSTNIIDTHYRSMNGVGYGFSVQDPTGHLSLGYFGYTAQRTDAIGPMDYTELTTTSQRNAAVKADSTTYNGNGNNLGAIYRLDVPSTPTFGFNLKNAGDTRFKAEGSEPDLVVKQDPSLAFSLSPRLGKGQFNFVTEVDELGEPGPFSKKYHLGTELLLGGLGSYAVFGIRAGYTNAGPSAGLNLNLGLIGFEASVYYTDLSPTTSDRVVEEREAVTAYVNIAEF